MKRDAHYLDKGLIHEINKLNIFIELKLCRQYKLLNSQDLSKLTNDNKSSDFSKEDIENLWQLGFLNADIVYSYKEINIEGIIFAGKKDDIFLYLDERELPVKASGYSNAISNLERIHSEIVPMFHPFRCYVLYKIYNSLKFCNFSSIQILLRSEGFNELITWYINRFNDWSSKKEIPLLFKYWNYVTSLAVISEPGVHRIIFNKVTWDISDNYKSILDRLKKIREKVVKLFQTIGEVHIEYYRDEICTDAEIIDSNKYLHLIIRLMKSDGREKLKGHISSAILFLAMAECLRRTLELAFQKEYPEEDECGFGEVFRDAKLLLQGSTRVLDGNRVVANQFLRRFGLDYGIRINIYVEGTTEFEALNSEFSTNSSVLIINLRGKFKEKQGKGVSFRESLRNDIKSKIFSLILLDGDVSENYRAVRKAAELDEICGMFFVSKPDFEFQNFKIDELTEIAFQLAVKKGLKDYSFDELKKNTGKVKSAKEFFKILHGISPFFLSITKGGNWGKELVKYAIKNPNGKEFGDENDRLINYVIRIIYNGFNVSYEVTRQKYKVDPESGKLIERNAQDSTAIHT
jgi:hypothetical protein